MGYVLNRISNSPKQRKSHQKMIGDRLRADEGDSRNMTRTPLARHATAIAVVLLTFFAYGPIQRLVGPTGPPLIFFVPAVTISAWQGGGGPGLLATAQFA
jgi:hypothetical protein